MILITNKGEFKIRYAYEHADGPRIVVDTKGKLKGPFMGRYGDEIPFTDDARKKYNAYIKN